MKGTNAQRYRPACGAAKSTSVTRQQVRQQIVDGIGMPEMLREGLGVLHVSIFPAYRAMPPHRVDVFIHAVMRAKPSLSATGAWKRTRTIAKPGSAATPPEYWKTAGMKR